MVPQALTLWGAEGIGCLKELLARIKSYSVLSVLMKFFPDLVRCMPVAENSPKILIRWAEKELLNLLTVRYRSTADDAVMH